MTAGPGSVAVIAVCRNESPGPTRRHDPPNHAFLKPAIQIRPFLVSVCSGSGSNASNFGLPPGVCQRWSPASIVGGFGMTGVEHKNTWKLVVSDSTNREVGIVGPHVLVRSLGHNIPGSL